LTLADIDRRTRAFQAAERLLGELIVDLGGEARASAGEREIAQRAAVLGSLIEDIEARWLRGETIALGDYLAATNAQRRLLATLGLERRARDVTPSLDRYLARDAA
jgi:glutathione S-transferase